MTAPLDRRCVAVLLAALSFALGVGLLAWGPIRLDPSAYRHAAGPASAADVLVQLPTFLVGVWGWIATRRSGWPPELRLPWRAFHGCAIAGAIAAAIHHAVPGVVGYVATQLILCAAFVMLTVAALAERVSPRFGSTRGLQWAAALVGVALALVASDAGGAVDVRPVVLLQVLPVLLVPAGAVLLPGPFTRTVDWLILLSLYGAGKVLDVADTTILQWTGWIGGHAAMHLCLAGVVGWLAYRAACAPSADASLEADSSKSKVWLTTVS